MRREPVRVADPGSDIDQRRRGLMLVALAAAVWSTGGLIVRILGAIDPWTTVFWRSVFAALFLLGFIAVRDRRRTFDVFRAMGWPGVLVGACFATASIAFVNALHLTSVANTLIILSTSPLIAAVLARFALGETVGPKSWIAMVVTCGGVTLMVSDSAGRGALAGDAIAFLIAIALAIATVTIRKRRDVRMTPATCLAAAIAAVASAGLAEPLSVGGADFALLAAFGALQLGAGLALFVTGARLAPAAQVSLISLLEPILGPLWVWGVLNEHPGDAALVGGGIVLATLIVHTALDLRRARPIPPAI